MTHRPRRIAISNIITAVSLATMVFIAILLLVQNVNLNRQSRDLSQEIQKQTIINQKFLRCLILVPAEQYQDKNKRIEAVDQCIKDSHTDDPTEAQPSSSQSNSNQTGSVGGNTSPTAPKATSPVATSSQQTTQVEPMPTPTQTPVDNRTATRQLLDGLHELTKDVPVIKGIL